MKAELQAKLGKLDGADKERDGIRDRIQAVRAKYEAKKKQEKKENT